VTATLNGKPTGLPVLAENVPPELTALARWVVWRYVPDADLETGEAEWDKPPSNARTGGLASSTNPATWAPFGVALAAYRKGTWDGIGFVLHRKKGDDGPGLVGVDLDKCRDPETGTIEPWALDIIARLDSYTEVSPSGRGIRIFVLGKLPPHGRKKGRYENYETGRYVTVTGQRVEGTPATIEDRQAELEAVHAEVFGADRRGQEAPTRGRGPALDLDDAELVRRACAAKNGDRFRRLWEGDASGYGSRSEADLALCSYLAFWCRGDEQRIAALFAQSGLFRPKWQREDYRNRTIAKALQGRPEFYDPERDGYQGNGGEHGGGKNGKGHAGGVEILPAPRRGATPKRTDYGNAIRLVERSGSNLRHCHPWGKWLVWDGRRWRVDDTAAVEREAKCMVVELFASATSGMAEIQKRMGS
jgi:primase-polymerase (primpol)-like protein